MRDKKQKGNVSILVIVVMSILLFFGLFIYQNINIDKRLSDMSINWFEEKNQLYNEAYSSEYLIENALYEAEEKALNYIYNQNYLKDKVSNVPDVLQQIFKEEYLQTPNKQKAYNNLLNNLYYFYANARLESLINEIPTLEIYKLTEYGIIKSISLNMNFLNENEELKLNVSIDVTKPSYDVIVDETGSIVYIKNNEPLYITKNFNIVQQINYDIEENK